MKSPLLKLALLIPFLSFTASSVCADYTLQLATYPYKSNAERFARTLKDQDHPAFIHTQERQISTGGLWYKVRLGPFSTMEAALAHKDEMISEGY